MTIGPGSERGARTALRCAESVAPAAVIIPPMELLRSNGTIADFARSIHTRLGLNRRTGLPRC
ncbi:hypothetical protein GCM10010360_40250 [Streptomyces nogalater]